MKHITGDNDDHEVPFLIAVIVSQFNSNITDALKQGALQRLIEKGFSPEHITLVEVPGAVEIPLIAKQLAKKGHYKAIIALGAVIRGETSHYNYVCQMVSEGCQTVALTFDIPVIFGVLTTENETQAWDRVGGGHGHKGVDAVDCALSMVAIINQLKK